MSDTAQSSSSPSPEPSSGSLSPLLPLKRPTFRMLWGVWMTANTCMWMNDVASAWLMTSLTASPAWVALVQTAATLPVFLLGLPSGAFADILDRRRYFIMTQLWVAIVATILSVAVLAELVTPLSLLLLTFANGVGLAMRWPVFAAIVPGLVSRPELPLALALNGVAMNASRIAGPLIAGFLIASAGSAYVFVLNAGLSLICAALIVRWRYVQTPHPLGRERLLSAMRVGIQFVRQSARLKSVLMRIALFFFHSTALLALLPLVARGLEDGDAGTFSLLLAAMGAGAIGAAMFLPRLRQFTDRDTLVVGGTVLQAAATMVVAFAPNAYVAVTAMFVAGVAWITTANSLSVTAQLGLPDWVRARGMSMYQMAIMGASATGAAVWGQIAEALSVPASLALAAVSGALTMLVANRFVPHGGVEEDLTPQRTLAPPAVESPPGGTQVVITIEYEIDPARADEFRDLMRESRRSRLRQGALAVNLLHDITRPGRYIEQIIDESWTEHLRRFDRMTAADIALRERKRAFHIGKTPPEVRRYVIDET